MDWNQYEAEEAEMADKLLQRMSSVSNRDLIRMLRSDCRLTSVIEAMRNEALARLIAGIMPIIGHDQKRHQFLDLVRKVLSEPVQPDYGAREAAEASPPLVIGPGGEENKWTLSFGGPNPEADYCVELPKADAWKIHDLIMKIDPSLLEYAKSLEQKAIAKAKGGAK